jgi:Nif-specific regulatory protein
VRGLGALHEISQSLCSIRDLDRLLEVAVERLSALLEAEGASIILADAEGEKLYFKAAYHLDRGVIHRLHGLRFPADKGIAGWVFRGGEPAVVADVERDPRFYPGVDLQTEARTRSLLCVPLRTKDRNLGVLEAVNKCHGPFAPADRHLLEAFAGPLAIAIENARLIQDLHAARERLREENLYLRETARQAPPAESLVGESASMQAVYRLVERVLDTTTTVLITGESGTGKELLARLIHFKGPRAGGPFIVVNCSAIPETLLEAELFGYERGAFTGALRRKPGRFELAHGGTLFLDEIGDMPLSLQAKLLRVLQAQTFERLGGTTPVTTDARIIAATNRDLQQLVAEGAFRRDLFYRLNVFPINLPPLRERREDILPIARHLLREHSRRLRKPVVELSKRAEELLVAYDWPGNVRELENVIERAVILSAGPVITEESLPLALRGSEGVALLRPPVKLPPQGLALADLERQLILQALERTGYNKSWACRLLGLSRTQLWTRIRRYGISPRPEPAPPAVRAPRRAQR